MIGCNNSEWDNHKLLMCDMSLNIKACWLCKHTFFSNVNQPILSLFFNTTVASWCACAWMPLIFGAHSAFFSLDTNCWHFSWSGNLIEGKELVQMEQLPLHAVLVGIPDSSLSTYIFCAALYAPFLHYILGWEPSFLWFLGEVYCSLEVCSFKDVDDVIFKIAVAFSGILISSIHKTELIRCPFLFLYIVKICL